jgi:hypothetical protein
MKFDVNKIITESIAEVNAVEVITEAESAMGVDVAAGAKKAYKKFEGVMGVGGTKANDEPDSPTFKAAKEHAAAAATKEQDPVGHRQSVNRLRAMMKSPQQRSQELNKAAATEKSDARQQAAAKGASKADTDSFQGKDAAADRAEETKKATEDSAKAAAEAQKEHDATAVGHLQKSVKKLGSGIEDEASKAGHKAANWIGGLDPGHVALAGGGAIAAGLGALALRKRLRKVK